MPDQPDLSAAIGLPPEEAINYFRAKGYAITWDWQEAWNEAHEEAFTVAKVAKIELLEDIRGMVDKALVSGITFEDFAAELEPKLRAHGWWGKDAQGVQMGSPHRMETIYRTNLQTAYMAGRYKVMEENADDRPYWQYVAVLDSKTRPAHAALAGKVFRHDDVFWNTHHPPLGFNCRCRIRALTEAQLKKKGLTVSSGRGNMVEKTAKAGGEDRSVTGWKDSAGAVRYTDPGWSYNPGKTSWINKAEVAAKERAALGGKP